MMSYMYVTVYMYIMCKKAIQPPDRRLQSKLNSRMAPNSQAVNKAGPSHASARMFAVCKTSHPELLMFFLAPQPPKGGPDR